MQKTKNFFKYFFNVFKQGKVLLLKFIITAALMAAVGVLSNLLQVTELTYLNAVLAVDYFATMVSFGISQSTNIFVNQNFHDAKKVNKYSRTGFQLNLVVVAIATALITAFPRFFMETIGEFMPSDYTFYYIMCGYFFLTGIKEYICEICRSLQFYKSQLICESLPIIVTILGFLVLYFAGAFYLNYIAIFYLASAVVGIVIGYILLIKNKKMKINLLGKAKINFTRQQWLIILSCFAGEVIWEIGYYAVSVFLLRLNDSIFNTYTYLENVLDIFNGIFFTFIGVTSVNIARALGERKFDDAYNEAKNSIWGTLIIWVAYMLLSTIFIYPIALGANKEYFNLMFSVVPLYVGIHIIRFLNWNTSTYMLQLGGKVKWLTYVEVIYAVVNILLCLIAAYLPQNLFLIYALIAAPDLIKLPIFIVVFLRKKWLANINDDPQLLQNQVKCVIFDFDDTLYYNMDWTAYYLASNKFFNEKFSETERKRLVKKYHLKKKHGLYLFNDKVMCQILKDSGYDHFEWLQICENIKYGKARRQTKLIGKRTLKKFAKLGKLYIVSNSSEKVIKEFADVRKFDLSIFAEVISNGFLGDDFTKEKYYKKIMEQNKLSPNQVLVIGDDYKNDLLPAKKLGMHIFDCDEGFTFDEVMG